jgi:succinate dehydrogenase / fumarate reductase flavoprotein subunit
MRQVAAARVELFTRREMVELICVDGVARGVVCRHGLSGALETFTGHAVLLASGGYSNVFYLSTNAVKSNASAIWSAHRQGACFANPCFTQIHPTCIPAGDTWQSKLTLMSESLRNDGRIWLPAQAGDGRPAAAIPEPERDYFLERQYPTYGNMVPRDLASRRARELCLEGRGVGPGGLGVYLDLAEAIRRDGREAIESRYGNLLEMYARITGEDPLASPLRIYPAPHYTMGGLWVDYHLMSTIPGLFVLGEANFSEHGANRLGASALMQGLADGYFIAPATVTAWLAGHPQPQIGADHPACRAAVAAAEVRIAALRPGPVRPVGGDGAGRRTATDLHRELGLLMIEVCGISRSAPELRRGLAAVEALRQEFSERVRVPDHGPGPDEALEKALRLEDFLGLADLMLRDALAREDSCGAHFREEFQTPEGEARRDDARVLELAAAVTAAAGTPLAPAAIADDDAVVATASVGTLFAVLATTTGSVWAKFNWGSFWNWDPRQTSIVVLLLIYAAFFLLRSAIDEPRRRARLSSVYAIVAFVSVPFLMFVLPRMLTSLHPGGKGDPGGVGPLLSPQSDAINPTKQVLFALSLFAFTLVYSWLVNIRMRVLAVQRQLDHESSQGVS